MTKGKRKALREKQIRSQQVMDVDDAPNTHRSAHARAHSPQSDVLKPQHDSGVQKVRQKKKPLRRNQRLRVEKGIERAEAVVDQMEKKVVQSEQKGKSIKGRRHDWEEINGTLRPAKPQEKRATAKRNATVETKPAEGDSNGATKASEANFVEIG